MSFLKCTPVTLKSGDLTLKYSICKSYRDKTSGKSLYFSTYLASVRRSILQNPKDVDGKRKFFIKLNSKLDEIGIGRASDAGELIKIGLRAHWAKAGFAV